MTMITSYTTTGRHDDRINNDVRAADAVLPV